MSRSRKIAQVGGDIQIPWNLTPGCYHFRYVATEKVSADWWVSFRYSYPFIGHRIPALRVSEKKLKNVSLKKCWHVFRRPQKNTAPAYTMLLTPPACIDR